MKSNAAKLKVDYKEQMTLRLSRQNVSIDQLENFEPPVLICLQHCTKRNTIPTAIPTD